MKKPIALLLFALAISANAQEDVTAQYIQNPSFEQDATSETADSRGGYAVSSVTGWTIAAPTSGFAVVDLMTSSATATDNNYGAPGTPSDGKQMLYIRNAWTAQTASLTQKVKLQAGKYKFAIDIKAATTSTSTASVVAGTASTSLSFSTSIPSTWTTTEALFEVATESTITLGLNINFVNGAGTSILLDNVKLIKLPDDYTEPEDPTEEAVSSFTEGVIKADFVPEPQMKADLLQMLANFSTYLKNDFQECAAPNSINEACGCFKGENTMGNDERGVRPNADLSMICAFLVKYGKPAGVTLPTGITWDKIEDMAMKSLIFAYSTHKANKLKVCSGNNYWGSTSTGDAVWESSLWAMSVAYSAFFQWDKLSTAQKGYIEKLLKAECNYELNRTIPTGYAGDTKAEENGWEADILAATLGLFPDDPLATKWFERLREFAINSYSHPSDINNTAVIDEWYDAKTYADLYKGQNLYDDYSLQNHNLFHTSYQNVVQQELGEAALALKMFQLGVKGEEKWKTNALMHHNQEVQDNILNWLALPDGELAMPNGNDWSLFLYDQITSYSTLACFLRDPHALMLENMAYKYIQARQKTTTDGSWLLRPDVGARRMGVEAHRVMMTYLMHDVLSTADLTPTQWDDFNQKFGEARMIPCQNIVRASTDDRFTCFSWSTGLKSYTGYFAANSPDKNKIVVPYRANNTGNLLGWYEVSGKGTNATPVVSGIYQLKGNGYVMNGELNVNDNTLNNRFALYSTPQNALIYLDYVTANSAATITAEKGGMLAISTDELMKTSRTLYYSKGENMTHKQLDGTTFTTFESNWVNIDNELGIVRPAQGLVAFGDRGANNSIYTSKLYPMYSNTARSVKTGDVVDARTLVYYSNINAEKTQEMASLMLPLRDKLPTGWNGVIVPDADRYYFIASNFKGENTATLQDFYIQGEESVVAPVFYQPTTINSGKATVTFTVQQNNSVAHPLAVMVSGSNLTAQLIDDTSAYITATADGVINVAIATAALNDYSIKQGETIRVYLENNEVRAESVSSFPEVEKTNYTGYIVNPSFEGNSEAGWKGSPTVDYNCAEKYNTTFDVYQDIEGLPAGQYLLACQGFYRAGTTANAASTHKAGTEHLNATLYANGTENVSTPLQSIIEEAGKKGAVGVMATSYGYVPNTMEQTSVYFRTDLYPNTLLCHVGDDGHLRIGVKKSTTIDRDWAIFDNFTLTRILEDTPEDPDAIRAVTAPGTSPLQGYKNRAYTLSGTPISAAAMQPGGIYIVGGKTIRVK